MASPSTARTGLVAVVKRDCPTCELVVPVLLELLTSDADLDVFVQDDPSFPDLGDSDPIDDTDLDFSFHHDIETVPTLIQFDAGTEVARTVGWSRDDWRALTGQTAIGESLPDSRPGCGSLSVDPLLVDDLRVRFGGSQLSGRRIELAALEDEFEAAFDRGWTDGLPVVPPTEARVLRMLDGTARSPADIVATVPPNLVEVTVEQVAINAVMAGCKPEYLPVVLAAVEAACTSEFNMHGLLATTYFSGPVIVVNGPMARRIGMNSGTNVFGQGNRANLTIGRALQLVVRNLGGGVPGQVDMACQGSPGKLAFCFAEREHDSPFTPLSVSRGLAPDASAVTLFAGEGPTPIVDQLSRTPESLARSMASVLRATHHPKLVIGWDAMLVVGPEHGRVFADAGWDRTRLLGELDELLLIPGRELVRGAGSIDEGLPPEFHDATLPKFADGRPAIVHAGGDAGLFSSVLPGWVGGELGSDMVTVKIEE
ncbi:MAG: thioredoxin [Acidimicrobiales bacterium]|nr:thioredoxin [Acidimicrobiales bacterium]